MVRFPECGRSRAEEGTSFPRLLGVHHAALPYVDVSAFFRESRSQNGIAVQALEFTILTASRTGESMNATWAKIDLSAKVFSIPADRMASSRPHRDPLSNAAIAVLNAASAGANQSRIARSRRADIRQRQARLAYQQHGNAPIV
jgi:hypothetical protein